MRFFRHFGEKTSWTVESKPIKAQDELRVCVFEGFEAGLKMKRKCSVGWYLFLSKLSLSTGPGRQHDLIFFSCPERCELLLQFFAWKCYYLPPISTTLWFFKKFLDEKKIYQPQEVGCQENFLLNFLYVYNITKSAVALQYSPSKRCRSGWLNIKQVVLDGDLVRRIQACFFLFHATNFLQFSITK